MQSFAFLGRLISIHALRKESDVYKLAVRNPEKISIHALRKESDDAAVFPRAHGRDFNPRSP